MLTVKYKILYTYLPLNVIPLSSRKSKQTFTFKSDSAVAINICCIQHSKQVIICHHLPEPHHQYVQILGRYNTIFIRVYKPVTAILNILLIVSNRGEGVWCCPIRPNINLSRDLLTENAIPTTCYQRGVINIKIFLLMTCVQELFLFERCFISYTTSRVCKKACNICDISLVYI